MEQLSEVDYRGRMRSTSFSFLEVVRLAGMTLALWSFGGFSPGALAAGSAEFTDDFETGGLVENDSPPGSWSEIPPQPAANLVNAEVAARHRGQYGMRWTDSDVEMGEGSQRQVMYFFDAAEPVLRARFWARIVSLSGAGRFFPFVLQEEISHTTLADLQVEVPAGRIWMGGTDRLGGLVALPTDLSVPMGDWHLFELEVAGVGSAAGQRRLWVDGISAGVQTGVDWMGLTLTAAHLGGPWQLPRLPTGVIDFDDFRMSSQPHATRLVVAGPSTGKVGECLPVQVGLLDVDDRPAQAPYPITVTEGSSTPSLSLHEDSRCASNAPPTISAQASGVEAFVRLHAAGHQVLLAEHPDFLPPRRPLEVEVVGEEGAHLLDLRVGCACSSSGDSLAFLGPLLGALFWRSRHR